MILRSAMLESSVRREAGSEFSNAEIAVLEQVSGGDLSLWLLGNRKLTRCEVQCLC